MTLANQTVIWGGEGKQLFKNINQRKGQGLIRLVWQTPPQIGYHIFSLPNIIRIYLRMTDNTSFSINFDNLTTTNIRNELLGENTLQSLQQFHRRNITNQCFPLSKCTLHVYHRPITLQPRRGTDQLSNSNHTNGKGVNNCSRSDIMQSNFVSTPKQAGYYHQSRLIIHKQVMVK